MLEHTCILSTINESFCFMVSIYPRPKRAIKCCAHSTGSMSPDALNLCYCILLLTTQCVQAMVKPREPGDFDGWHRTPIERVAYLLNLLLGLDYVPPTVYRQHLEVEGRHYADGGAVIYFVDSLKLLEEVPEGDWGIGKRSLMSDTRVLVRSSSYDLHRRCRLQCNGVIWCSVL